ncbi:MAG: hypothetical protein HY904_13510 [Deltaproteobacteria bacterium]|nr:hypothetical protein [Deltaproteobacteria bacterium]
MIGALSFEQAPPLWVPLRFFLTAPWFLCAAGLLLAVDGAHVVAGGRWGPGAVAAVHLVTAGYMLQVMAGALLQFMPVAAGANVWRPRLTGGVAHAGFTAGGAALVAGFLWVGVPALQAATVLMGGAGAFYVVVLARGLAASPAIGPTLRGLRFAVFGLAVTVALGVALASVFGFGVALPLAELVPVHAAWGLAGWALTLLAAVAWLVVPMFQLTPPYPPRFAFAFPLAVCGVVLGWTAAVFLRTPAVAIAVAAAGTLVVGAFGGATLRLQGQRKRRVTDATLECWRAGMAALCAAAVLFPIPLAVTDAALRGRLEWLAGVLVLGAFVAVIQGMLHKIVPFLVWLHLRSVMAVPPTMQKVLPDARARPQSRLLLASILVLALAAAWPPLAHLGGVLLAVAAAWGGALLVGAARFHHRLAQSPSASPDDTGRSAR